MKKNFLVMLMLVLFSTLCMTACNLSSSIYGNFKQSEYVISLEEVVDFYDELKVKGADKEKVNLSSSNEEVLKSCEGGFCGVKSGKAYILASFHNKVIAKSQIYVKHRLNAPQNVYVDENSGKVSFDKSFVIVDGNKIEADEYLIEIKKEGSENVVSVKVEKEEFYLNEMGSYEVGVVAISKNSKVDPSDKKHFIVNYGVMSWAGNNIKFEVQKKFNQKATVSWKDVANACYDVYVEGIKLATDARNNSFDFDLSSFEGGQDVEVEVVLKDIDGIKVASSKSITVEILSEPEIEYVYDGTLGMLKSQYLADACGFLMQREDLSTGEVTEKYFDRTDETFLDNVSGAGKGIYNVRLIAVGGQKNGRFYANSKQSNLVKFGKLAMPQADVKFIDNRIVLTFSQDSYVTNYKVSWGEGNLIFDTTTDGLVCDIDLGLLAKGNYDLTVTALPTQEGGHIKELVVGGGYSSENVVCSDDFVFNFFKLDSVGQISHSLTENSSRFEFVKIENANDYRIYLDDVLLESQISFDGEKVIMDVGLEELKKFAPTEDRYDVKIVALYVEDEIQHSFLSSKIKQLEILPIVEEADSQENGSFKWNAVDRECGYSYLIYQTDESFDTTGLDPIFVNETQNNQILETLSEGYYNIKIATISKDYDNLLDSDFYDNDNVFSKDFIVTKKIASPEITIDQSGELSLIISAVEHGGEYQVYVDGVLDGSVSINQINEEIVYKFKNTLSQAKDYDISVVACGGDRYDNNIYLDSDPSQIVVTRLGQPNQKITDIYSESNELLGQNISIEQIAGSKAVKFMLNGEELLIADNFNLDMTDKTKFGSEFKLGIILLANESSGDHYYINSIEKELQFDRVNSPSVINYSNGYVSWQNDDQRVKNYYFSLILENSKTSDYYYRFMTSTLDNNLNLQSNIDSLCKSDIKFLTAYRQAENIRVELISYRNGFEGDVYLLPSINESTKEIYHLEKVSVTFDPQSKVISWNELVSETTYDIFLDDGETPFVSDCRRNSYDISDVLNKFSSQRKITILAKNSKFLSSEFSDAIFIKQLASPRTISIERNGNKDIVLFNILSDSAFVGDVLINGSSENITYVQGSGRASFDPKDFESEEFAITLKAKNDSQINFYVDSNEILYTLKDLAQSGLKARILPDAVGWVLVAQDMTGNNIDPIVYEVSISCKGVYKTITLKSQDIIELDDIEELFGMSIDSDFKIFIKAKIDKAYTISYSQDCLGYYGESNTETLDSTKLKQIEINGYEIKNGDVLNEIESKTTSKVIVSFKDKWADLTDIKFEVSLLSVNNTFNFETVAGDDNQNYKLSLTGGVYSLEIKSAIIEKFESGNIEIIIKAKKDEYVSSDSGNIIISRFDNVDNAEITDNGLFIINDDQKASYLVEINIGTSTLVVEMHDENSLDLTQESLLLNRKGAFTIKIIAYDKKNKTLASHRVMTYNGYRLEGIEKIEVDDEGYLNFILYDDDFRDLIFVAKRDSQVIEFMPVQDVFTKNRYYIAMLDLLKLFDPDLSMQNGIESIDFMVKRAGSINSKPFSHSFNYEIETTNPNLIKSYQSETDYILFDLLDDGSQTLSFRVTFFAKNLLEGQNDKVIIKTINASDVLGYWITDGNGRAEFSKLPPVQSGLISKEVYALNLSTLLEEVDYGEVDIEVSRIGKNGLHTQFNSTKYSLYKLNSIKNDQTLHIANNTLSFSWISSDEKISANSFMIYLERQGNILKINSPVSSLNLLDAGLVPGETYSVYVVALNNDRYTIASNRSTFECKTLQFTKPSSLEVKNGILQFSQQSFENSKFVSDMIDYFGQINPGFVYHEEMGEREYKDIYYFLPAYLERFNVSLKFNRIEDGKITNKIYTLTTKAYNLFPDLMLSVKNTDYIEYLGEKESMSYFELLSIYKTKLLEGNEGVKAGNVRLMIDALSKSTRGIGDGGYLFDDSGRDIPAGEYLVSIMEDNYQQYIQSQNSDGVRMYLSSAPKVTLSSEETNGKINYFAGVTPSITMIKGDDGYVQNVAQRYKLQLRKSGQLATNTSDIIDFLIEFDELGNRWILSFKGQAIEDVLVKEEDSLNFKINMTMLGKKLQALGEKAISINELYQADIFVYNQDNGYCINGKSGIFNLRYLDLRAEDIHFEDGKFVVETNSEGFELLLRYKRPASAEQSRTIRFVNGRADIDLKDTGLYEYVMLSLNGSYSNSTLNVESSSYKILDVYKLSAPTLNVSNGSISVSYNKHDAEYCGNLRFNLGNNVSLADDYQGEDKGYYYQSLIMANSNLPLYRVGSFDANDKVKFESELSANEFYSFLRGNSGSFIIRENEDLTSDFILTFESNERPMISSTQSQVLARMLDGVSEVEIQKGDIKINNESFADIYDVNGEKGTLLYEISVDYYYKDNTSQNSFIFAKNENIYCESVEGGEKYIEGQNIKSDYSYYTFSVSIVPARVVKDDATENIITSLEGNKYRLSDGLTFEDETYALRSLVTKTAIVTRTSTPRLSQRNSGVNDGKINFITDRSVYYGDNPETIDLESANRISIFADYTAQGIAKTVLLKGKYTFSTSTVSGEENNAYVSFLPDDGQLNDAGGSIKLRIYTYGKDENGQNAIKSNPLEINDVYKLEKIDERYYEIKLIDGKTAIDFSKYFTSVSIQDNRDCYKIVLNYVTDEGENSITLTNKSASKLFVLPQNIISLSFQAKDGQGEQEINRKKILSSDLENLTISPTSIDDLEITYNNDLKRFEWKWPEENQNKYQYFINLLISGNNETMFTTDNFYCPRNIGTIYPNAFKIKARMLSDDNSEISIFSQEKVYENNGNIECRPFTGGNGSQSNPYQIATAQDFANIRLRNTNDFYFKLVSNIEIDSADNVMGLEEFKGHLNGNGFKITFNSSSVNEMEKISQYLIGFDGLEFESYSSLFKSVSQNAEVKNLNISYNINFRSVNGSKTIFAPVCAFNYGTIENVNLSEFNIALAGNNSSVGNYIFVGGIAGYNYGLIQNCQNSAQFDYVMPQGLPFSFAYAGITLFNATSEGNFGSIVLCKNSGDKKINVAVGSNKFYMSGITLSNVSKISMCGNDGAISVSARTSNVSSIECYFAGITITSINGTLEYLYNNGRITSESIRGDFVYSGVVYQIIGGSINGLVETQTGQPITRSCQSNTIDYGGHYASNNSGTAINIQVNQLAEVSITCIDGHKLNIKNTEKGYVASIE